MRRAYDLRVRIIPVVVLLVAAPALAGTVPDEEMLIAAPDCHYASDASWKLTGEVKLSQVLTALSELTCERFFVPRALASTRVTIDVGDDRMSAHELRDRVQGALRAKGIVIDFVAASRVRRSSDLAAPTSLSLPPARPAISAEKLDQGIHCIEQKCTLKRELLDAMLADSTGLAASARIVPNFRDGKAVGFKLYGIRPSSYFQRLGFENGDTLLTINGADIASPDKALEAYVKIRNAAAVTVGIERRGKPFTLAFIIE
jgi:hypothetical protein